MLSPIPQKSIVIAAHPDDEALWFSSILNRVERIIICYVDNFGRKTLGERRRRALARHPLKPMSLDLTEPMAYLGADFHRAKLTQYGIKIRWWRSRLRRRYKESFDRLHECLAEHVSRDVHVYTHNPWGEYGNEDHVQLHRVVCDLAEANGAEVWCPNYCASRSLSLAVRILRGQMLEHMTFPTNQELLLELARIYDEEQCWTWPKKPMLFSEESFVRFVPATTTNDAHLSAFPINFLWDRRVPSVLLVNLIRLLKGY
jgi:LmbE family N-acetylglucosaminyl deacetylase